MDEKEGKRVKVETPGFPDGWVTDGEIHDLYQLVRWLARPYGENLPIFAEAEGQPERARLLSDLYKRIVGRTDFQLPPSVEWWRCPECDTWQTRALEVIDV